MPEVQPWLVALWGGIFILLTGGIWIYVVAARTSLLWLIGCALLPPLIIPFAAIHSTRTAFPALLCVVGGALAYMGQLRQVGDVPTDMLLRWAFLVPAVILESFGYRLPFP